MGVILFGKGYQFAVPKPGLLPDCLSPDTYYTHPTLDSCYSPYGFAYPLDGQGVPLDVLLDGKLPLLGSKVKPFKLDHQFLLVDFQRRLWKVIVLGDDDDPKKLLTSISLIDHQQPGWWITTRAGDAGAGSPDVALTIGFLASDPTPREVDQFWFTYHGTKKLQWMSLTEIHQTLEERFYNIPISKKEKLS
jgi:hypothetical protein